MIPCQTCRDLHPKPLNSSISSFSSKPSSLVLFNSKTQNFEKLKHTKHTFRTPNSHAHNLYSNGSRLLFGFKLHCHSKTVSLPLKNGKKNSYSGSLSLILRYLDSENDVGKTLLSVWDDLSPKEQTVILKEQGRSWERVVRVFEFFKSRDDYVPNVIHYNVVLRALGKARRWDELRVVWIEMARDGVAPTNNTYGMLVDVYGKAGLVKEGLLWIKHMRIRGLFPDEVTMNTVLRVLKEAGEFDRAKRFYEGWCGGRIELGDLELDFMVGFDDGTDSLPVSFKHFLLTELFRAGRSPRILTNLRSANDDISIRKPQLTSTYNTLIDLYGKAGRLGDAGNVLAEMLRAGVKANTTTFNTMIFTCGSHGLLSEAESLVTQMEERGISPDTKTYNIFISLYAAVGDIKRSLQCYRNIRIVGLFPDVETYRAILHILCRKNMVEEVETVIDEIKKFGQKIDEHSLPVVMQLYINEGLLEKAKTLYEDFQLNGRLSSKTRAAILDAYAEKGLSDEAETVFYGNKVLVGNKKDVVEYNVMIKAYGKAKRYSKAFSLFKAMRNCGIWPDACTYNSLIQMFSGGDLVKEASDLLVEMQDAGFKPNCETFCAVIACYTRLGKVSDAVNIYEEMVNEGVKPNEVVYGSLINGFAESSRIEEAFRYFRIMEESGLTANPIVLTSLIKAYSRIGSVEGAIQIYEKIKDFEGGPDIVASNSMISLYADLGMISEAKLMFDNLKNKGTADGVTFATMMYLYKNMGMLNEAIDVAEEMKQSGLLRDCNSYNKVMACYANNGQLRECGELLHEMDTENLSPDRGTFKVLFTVLKKGGIPAEFVMQLESLYKDGKAYASEAVITCVYSVVGLHALALKSCNTFRRAKSTLDSSVYNVAIYAYGASGDIEKALNMFMKMQDKGLEPDLVTYISLVSCYGKAGMVEGVKRIQSLMSSEEFEPSESLLKAVIDAYRIAHRNDLAELVNQEMNFIFASGENTRSVSEDESAGTSSRLYR